MSVESARDFLKRLKDDEAFKSKISTIADKEERIKFVESEGFDFTEEEFNQVRKELSPEALDQAAGGGHCGFTHESERCFKDCVTYCDGRFSAT